MADIFTEVVNKLGSPKYNGMDIFGEAKNLGVGINVNANKTITSTSSQSSFLGGFFSNPVETSSISYSFDQAQLKAYYEAFTGAANQRKQQIQLFGKQAASANIF